VAKVAEEPAAVLGCVDGLASTLRNLFGVFKRFIVEAACKKIANPPNASYDEAIASGVVIHLLTA